METIRMQMTKKEAGEMVADLIRDHFQAENQAMPVTIGIMQDGTIDTTPNVYDHYNCYVDIYDTEDGGSSLGGNYGPEEWTDADEKGYAEIFADHWIDDIIVEAQVDDWDFDIEWPQAQQTKGTQ